VRTLSAAALALNAAASFTISCGGIVDPSKNQMGLSAGRDPQGFTSHSFSVNRRERSRSKSPRWRRKTMCRSA